MRPSQLALAFRLGGLLAVALLPALVHAAPPVGWEAVPPEQLSPGGSTIEPGVGAEVVSWRVWIEDGVSGGELRQTREHYVRIKIYTDQGAQSFARVDIDYPLRDASVEFIAARTLQPDGSATPLDRKAVVRETVVRKKGEGLRRQSFAPPALKAGCIVEYRYREIRYNEAATGIYELQREIPIQKLIYHVKPLRAEGWNLRQMFFHVAAASSPTPTDGYYETTIISQPAYNPEPFSPPEYQQRAWMLQYYTEEALISPEAFWRKHGRQQWEWFDPYTRPDKETQALAQQIAEGATSEADRVRRLAEWIQREFKISRPDAPDSLRTAGPRRNGSLRDAVRQRGGTSWDADLVFAGLARSLGLQTRLLRVPSRRRWFFDRRVMMHGAFLSSYEIAVRVDGRWLAFDPANRYLPWDMVPWDEEAQLGLLCERDSSRFMDTPVGEPERSCLSRAGTFTLAEDGTVAGDVTLSFGGHWNETLRWAFEGASGADLDSTLIEEASWSDLGLKLSRVELVRGSDEHEPLQVKCHLVLPEFAMVTGKRILLEPAVLVARRRPPFTAGTRRFPLYFPYPWSERDSLRLRLPDGWKVETVDTPRPVDAPGVAAYECQTRVSDDGREILYQRSLRFGQGGTLLFPASQYAGIKSLFDQVHERDQATVVLTRVGSSP
jgi:hypothetical protein